MPAPKPIGHLKAPNRPCLACDRDPCRCVLPPLDWCSHPVRFPGPPVAFKPARLTGDGLLTRLAAGAGWPFKGER
jgi:hypothetical protein